MICGEGEARRPHSCRAISSPQLLLLLYLYSAASLLRCSSLRSCSRSLTREGQEGARRREDPGSLPAGLAHHRAWAQGQAPSGFPLLAQASFPVLLTDRTPGGVGMCGESRDTDTVTGGKWEELQGLGAKCKEPREGSEGPAFWKSLGRLDLIRQMGWTTRPPRAPKCNDPDHTRTCRKPLISPIQTSWAVQSDCVWSSRGNRVV